MKVRHLCFALCLVNTAAASTRAGDVLTVPQAAAKMGQDVVMTMKVQATGTITGDALVLLSEAEFQHPDAFFVRIAPAVQSLFRDAKIPEISRHYRNKFIKVTGKVGVINFNFGKRPAISIDDPNQIEITDPEAALPPGAEIVELYKSGKLFQREEYKKVRAAFSSRFETNHQADIMKAFGDDYSGMNLWFAKNIDAKENLYTALLEGHDNIPAALALFKEIWKQYPKTLEKWSQLAIATAVTWDDARGVYDYKNHQTRVNSTLPDGMLDALENYKYVVDNEKKMPLPVYYYPWEFLVFIINHRTPMPERLWAQSFYQSAKSKTKSWHQDVPYDMAIIHRELEGDKSATPKLTDRVYTLENIRKYGGVCAHQADFACRTAKSIGIPAVYCSGQSAYRESHAWWMYVYIDSATKTDVKFKLISDGRFDGKDNFHTGQVLDPQTGMPMLDRDMERRLWLAGTDRVGKRLTSLIMRVYSSLASAESFDVKDKMKYLDRCLSVSKYNEDAWINFALMAKRGELADENKKIALGHLAKLNQTFESYPDFIWRIFDDLVDVSTPAEQTKLYENVLALFERARRPDLACDARLKLTDLLIENSKQSTAFTGLNTLIHKYPNEGRYIPRLMRKLETVAGSVKDGPAKVGNLYAELIPNLMVYYGSASTVYTKTMTEQARTFMKENNLTQALATLETRIQVARAKVKAK